MIDARPTAADHAAFVAATGPTRAPWWLCGCGCPLYDHGARRQESQSGLTYGGCRRCGECVRWVNAAGQDFYDGALRDPFRPAVAA